MLPIIINIKQNVLDGRTAAGIEPGTLPTRAPNNALPTRQNFEAGASPGRISPICGKFPKTCPKWRNQRSGQHEIQFPRNLTDLQGPAQELPDFCLQKAENSSNFLPEWGGSQRCISYFALRSCSRLRVSGIHLRL